MRFIHNSKNIFLEPKISGIVFLLSIFFAIYVTWYAGAQGKLVRETNLFVQHSPGEEVRSGNLSFMVEKLRHDPVGAGPLVPRPGHEFLIPTIVLKNNRDKTFDFIPLLSLYVKDKFGNVYSETAIPSEEAMLSGPILPHDILREEVGFEVPTNASDLVLYFETGNADRAVITINLSSQTVWEKLKNLITGE